MEFEMGFGGEKAIAILRVSSHRQKDGASHDVQSGKINEYAKAAGLAIAREFTITESAKSSEHRVLFQAAITFALNQRIKHVLFYMYDRESRNLTDNERNENLMRQGKLAIHYVSDGKVIDENSPDSDFFMRDVHAVTNKQFCRVLSAKVKDAQERKAEEGWFPLNHAPLGYAHILPAGQKRGTTIGEADAERVALVRREFELRAQGFSTRAIRSKCLDERLVPFPMIASYHQGSIHRRLSNPFYWGEFEFRGKRYKGKHPLIIPQEHLDAVAGMEGRPGYKKTNQFVLGQFMRCYECDSAVCGNLIKGRYVYYRCGNTKKKHPRAPHVPEALVFTEFAKAMDAIYLHPAKAKAISLELTKAQQSNSLFLKNRAETARHQLTKLAEKEDELYSDLKNGILSLPAYDRMRKTLNQERETLGRQAKAPSIPESAFFSAQKLLQLAQEAKSLYEFAEPKEKKLLIENVTLTRWLDGVSVRFDLRKDFLLLGEIGEGEGMRPQIDAFLTHLSLVA
jgi:site-specific DNA recombinase